MDLYLVESPHTTEGCEVAIDYFHKYHAGFFTHFEWGCLDGDHTAYAFIEAENHEQAKLAVPPILRGKARVIKLTTFDPSKEDTIHRKSTNYKRAEIF